jgi:hypothetical protein
VSWNTEIYVTEDDGTGGEWIGQLHAGTIEELRRWIEKRRVEQAELRAKWDSLPNTFMGRYRRAKMRINGDEPDPVYPTRLVQVTRTVEVIEEPVA